jgi:hypothetical protein
MRLRQTLQNFALLLACLSWSAGLACAETISLEGSVEHSETLHPVDAFTVGAEYDENLLPSGVDSEGNWWRVPKWLAGQWEKTGKIEVLSFTDLKTNQSIPSKKRTRVTYHDREVLGHQSDGHGQIWTYVPVPCIMKSSAGETTNVNVINAFDVVSETPESITLKIFCVTVMVDSNNKVTSICQRESLQTWTPVNDHLISIKDSTKFFDRDGVPLAAKKMQTYTHRCGGYCPVNYIDKATHRPLHSNPSAIPLNLRNSFAEFLRTHNLTSLIP